MCLIRADVSGLNSDIMAVVVKVWLCCGIYPKTCNENEQQELRTLFSIFQHSLDFPPSTAYL